MARHQTADAIQAVAEALFTEFEAIKAAGRPGSAALAAYDRHRQALALAMATDRDLPLANPGRLFRRAAALLDAASPRKLALATSEVLVIVLGGARTRQAAACADKLLPALVADCARKGETCSPGPLHILVSDSPDMAARARELGALDALLRRAAALTPGVDDRPEGEGVGQSLEAAGEILRLGVNTAEELRAFVEQPGVLSVAARWLKRGGSPVQARTGAARLVATLINRPEGAATAPLVLGYPGIVRGIAEAVADAADFRARDRTELTAAACGAAAWGGPPVAAMLSAAPGFLDGVALTLATPPAPPGAPRETLMSLAYLARNFAAASVSLNELVAQLAGAPTRALLEARPRLVAALDARAAHAEQWAAEAEAVAGPSSTTSSLKGLARTLAKAKAALRKLTAADLVDQNGGGNATEQAGGGAAAAETAAAAPAAETAAASATSAAAGGGGATKGAGSSGSSAAASATAPATGSDTAGPATAAVAATPHRRCCLACGREDGSGASGAALLQCAGCKGTGLKAFFCDRACLKAGWKAHKPDCEAARRRGSGGGGGGGGGGAAS